ncbi:MAG TPA: SRPBCC domain-containing protein [Ignavibacteria bacterium]|nr:SRPBCC domain-containing protein [Ignavibacteria bacterium]HRA99173.1 SRPBCC domain-containing protein [Ignavibacteria bacterium]
MEKTIYTKDIPNKKIFVKREFNSSPEIVWKAWTESELLDKWWAPKPWTAKTKSMDFTEGGTWMYCMCGPDDEKVWCKVVYKKIDEIKSFEGTDAFCDENGIESTEMPGMYWIVSFKPSENGTTVDVEITFDSEEDLKKIVEMGFQDGFASGHYNLDELLRDLTDIKN